MHGCFFFFFSFFPIPCKWKVVQRWDEEQWTSPPPPLLSPRSSSFVFSKRVNLLFLIWISLVEFGQDSRTLLVGRVRYLCPVSVSPWWVTRAHGRALREEILFRSLLDLLLGADTRLGKHFWKDGSGLLSFGGVMVTGFMFMLWVWTLQLKLALNYSMMMSHRVQFTPVYTAQFISVPVCPFPRVRFKVTVLRHGPWSIARRSGIFTFCRNPSLSKWSSWILSL